MNWCKYCHGEYPVHRNFCPVTKGEKPEFWEAYSRIDIIGQNGNDGDHYDAVDHPKHYTDHPSGIECIQITEHMNFCLGNAVKYIWRADLKHDAIEDLKKAKWYLEREIAKREGEQLPKSGNNLPNAGNACSS